MSERDVMEYDVAVVGGGQAFGYLTGLTDICA
jgi:hypothetical protein